MQVAILGGGIAGLAAAIALRQLGLRIAVYERQSGPNSLGAGVVLWPNACFVLSELHLLDRVSTVSGIVTQMRRISERGLDLGTLDLGQLTCRMGYSCLSVLRVELLRILFDRATELGVPVYFGYQATNLVTLRNERVRVAFQNGKSIEPDIVLGADGRMSSVARAYVTGDANPVYQGFVNWIGVCEHRQAVFENVHVLDFWGTGKRFGVVPISQHQAYWAGAMAVDEHRARGLAGDGKVLCTEFGDWPEPVPTIVAQHSNDAVKKILVYDHDPVSVWHRDNVLLIGDAAHAALPTSGQGTSQALEDAWWLAQIFESPAGNLATNFRQFTEKRVEKTAGVIQGGRSLAKILFETNGDLCAERNRTSQRTDFSALVAGMAKAWGKGLPLKSV